MKLSIPENCAIVSLLAPASDAAGRTSGIYPSLKNAVKAWIVVFITQGNAATIAIAPKQASAVAGTGTKVLTNEVPIYTNLDMAAATAFTKQTAAKNYTTDAGVKHKCVVFEIDPVTAMDIDNATTPFDCIGVTFGASHADNITSALLLIQPKYKGDAQPDYITD